MQPGNAQTLTYLGKAQQGTGNLDAALKAYQEAAEATRTEHLPFLLASRVQVLQGQIGPALVTLRQAILRKPTEPSLFREFASLCLFAGAPDAAMRAAIELRLKLPESADAIYLHGLSAFVAGKDEDADRILREALEKAPGRLGDDAEAKKLLEETLTFAPGEVGAANDLAVLHLSKPGGAHAARKVLSEALKSHPDDPGLHLNLALALADSDAATALTHARRAQASQDKNLREQADRLVTALAPH